MNETEIKVFTNKVRPMSAGPHKTKAIQTQSQTFTEGNNGVISGYFSTFESPENPDRAGEIVRPGAFAGTIERRKQTGTYFPLCYNHDLNQVIGRVTEIHEDRKGCFFTAEFFPTKRAQEVRGYVISGAVFQFSFAYDVLKSGKVKDRNGNSVNELRELELYEISIVVVPANANAIVTDFKNNISEMLKSKKEKLLSFIDTIDDNKHKKENLLAFINATDNNKYKNQKSKLNRLLELRKMEAQAEKNIQEATEAKNTEWKRQRMNALNAIRAEIRTIKGR